MTVGAGGAGAAPVEVREAAESFGVNAEKYDRFRPSYPPQMVARFVETLPGREVLDVGIGTGIAAKAFAAAGCHVFGVEADERMANVARRAGFHVEVDADCATLVLTAERTA